MHARADEGRASAPRPVGREDALLGELEAIRRAGEVLTVADFLRRVGYVYRKGKRKGRANRQAIQRYPRLRSALNRYCVQERGRYHLASPAESAAALQAAEQARGVLAAERDRLAARVERLVAEVAVHEKARGAASETQAALTRENRRLRGLASAIAAYATQRSAVHAADLLRMLSDAANSLGVEVPTPAPPSTPPSASPPSPVLTLARGGGPPVVPPGVSGRGRPTAPSAE